MADFNDKNVILITEFLKQRYSPIRLFLYGSRANGNFRPDSDYDFVMVVHHFDSADRYEVMSSIGTDIHKAFGVDAQVWTYSEEEFLDWKDEFSSIPETALNTGKEIELGRSQSHDPSLVCQSRRRSTSI